MAFRRQAHHAVTLYLSLCRLHESPVEADNPESITTESCSPETFEEVATKPQSKESAPPRTESVEGKNPKFKAGASWVSCYEQLTAAIKTRHYSDKTLRAYRGWVRKFQTFTRSKPPESLSVEDVKAFLSHLAVDKNVAASTQNQAFNALLFLFRHVLGKEFGKVEGVVRAKRRRYIPEVLSPKEVERLLLALTPPFDLVARLLYGCGLRLFEALKLRVKDLDFENRLLTVHDGKAQKDRSVPLPDKLIPVLREQIESVHAQFQEDLGNGYDGVFLPTSLSAKYASAAKEFGWQWLFPTPMLRVS